MKKKRRSLLMKRPFCLLLSLLMLAFCIPAWAESAEWDYDAAYCVLRGYGGAGGDVVVPGEIDSGITPPISHIPHKSAGRMPSEQRFSAPPSRFAVGSAGIPRSSICCGEESLPVS